MGLFQNFETVEPAKVKRSSRAKLGAGGRVRRRPEESFTEQIFLFPCHSSRSLSREICLFGLLLENWANNLKSSLLVKLQGEKLKQSFSYVKKKKQNKTKNQ